MPTDNRIKAGSTARADSLVEAIGTLAGAPIVASTLEVDVLPSRVVAYRPNALDEDGAPVTLSQLDPDPNANCGAPETCDASGTLMQCSLGPAGRFSVVDPDASNAP